VRTWAERLGDALVERHGAREGARLAARFASTFPEEYRATTGVAQAAEDVGVLAAVAADGAARIVLRNDPGRRTTRLQLYLAGEPLVLSEFMPVLENLGLRALAEDQIAVETADGARLALQAFHVQDRRGERLALDVAAAGSATPSWRSAPAVPRTTR
jgi:glutamate dehydrogenase